MPITRLLVAAAGAATLVALASGCGGSAESSGSTAPERRAAAASCPESGQSMTYNFAFSNTTSQDVVLDVDPGWDCAKGRGPSLEPGWVGNATPATLTGLRVGAGDSVTRTLRFAPVPTLARQGRFELRFSTSEPASVIRSVPISFGGRRDGGGWWGFGTPLPNGDWTCRVSLPTALPDGTPASISVNAFGARSCGAETVRITIAPGT